MNSETGMFGMFGGYGHIAAINGTAVGGGLTPTFAADIRICSSTAKLGMVFARRGIVPEAASAYFLPKLVGVAKALEWCMTGRVFPATEAEGTGLFNYLLPYLAPLPLPLEPSQFFPSFIA